MSYKVKLPGVMLPRVMLPRVRCRVKLLVMLPRVTPASNVSGLRHALMMSWAVQGASAAPTMSAIPLL